MEALIAEKDFAGAEAVFARIDAAHVDAEWHARIGLTLAQRRNDIGGILLHAGRLREILPAQPKGYGAACVALRAAGRLEEAEALIRTALEACPNAPGLWAEAAELARERGDFDLAYARWAELRARAPKSSMGFVGAARLSQRRQQPELTRTLVQDGLQAFPNDRHLLHMAARAAANAVRWDDAAAHWTTLLGLFPDEPKLALEAATSMLGPRYGRDRRIPKILAQLDEIHARFPDFVAAYAAHLQVLRECRKLDDAETLGAAWCARFPDAQVLGVAWARVAQDQGRHEDAIARLEALRARLPANAPLEAAFVRALSLGGHEPEAEVACTRALVAFPGNPALVDQHVALASRRGDFIEAAGRAEAAAAAFPQVEQFSQLGARMRTLTDDGAHSSAAADMPAPEVAKAGAAKEAAEFFLRFESLGATMGGCEFGLVQRQFGAEPLGLLRWASMPIQNLTTALQNRLEGLGAPENTRITVQRGSANHREYYIFDDRYGYWTHTFIQEDDAPQDRVLQQSLRRMVFLRDKLLEDLEQANKILVYKITTDEKPEALDALFEALQRYGKCTLLCAMMQDAGHPRGTVEMRRPGLFVGRASMFMGGAPGGDAGIDAELWRYFCEYVAAWHDEQAPEEAEG